MNTKISAEAKLEQRGKDVVRHYVKLQLCNVVTTLALCCQIAEPSLLNVATTLPSDVSKTFISNELILSIQPIAQRCDIVLTTPFFLVACQ